MTIQLDHLMIPSKDRNVAARQLAHILGVPWGPANVGPFTAVYVSSGLTIDFDQWEETFSKGHSGHGLGVKTPPSGHRARWEVIVEPDAVGRLTIDYGVSC